MAYFVTAWPCARGTLGLDLDRLEHYWDRYPEIRLAAEVSDKGSEIGTERESFGVKFGLRD